MGHLRITISSVILLSCVFSHTFAKGSVLNSVLALAFFVLPGYLIIWIAAAETTSIIENICFAFIASFSMFFATTFVLVLINVSNLLPLILLSISSVLTLTLYAKQHISGKRDSYEPCSPRSIVEGQHTVQPHRYETYVLLLSLLYFFVELVVRNPTMLAFPDEYQYMTHAQDVSLYILSYSPDAIFHVFEDKLVFTLIVHGFQNLTSTSLASLHPLPAFFSSFLLLATYLLGSRVNDNTALVASVLMAFNPLLWFWSYRIMPDILTSVFAVLSLIYVLRAFQKRGEVDKVSFFCAILCFAFSLFVKMLIILWVIPFAAYFASGAIREKQSTIRFYSWKLGPPIVIAATIGIAILSAPYLVYIDLARFLGDVSVMFQFTATHWNNFFFNSYYNGAWAVWVYPHYYTTAVAGLMLVGFVIVLARRPPWLFRREIIVWLSCILLFLSYFSIASGVQVARNIFPCYPLFMVLAAIAFLKNLRRYSVLLIPLLVHSVVFLFAPETGVALFGGFTVNELLPSRCIWIAVIVYKIVEGLYSERPHSIARMRRFRRMSQALIIGAILIVCSFYMHLYTSESWYRDTVTDTSVGLPQAMDWFVANTTPNSTIITSAYVQLMYYLPDYCILAPPANISLLFDEIDNHSFHYLIIFFDARLRIDNYPYLWDFRNQAPPYMTEVERVKSSDLLYVVYHVSNH